MSGELCDRAGGAGGGPVMLPAAEMPATPGVEATYAGVLTACCRASGGVPPRLYFGEAGVPVGAESLRRAARARVERAERARRAAEVDASCRG